MGKHICISNVINKQFIIGKIYEDIPDDDTIGKPILLVSFNGCWIKDDNGSLEFFSKADKSQNNRQHYSDYFECISKIRNDKINTLING